MSSYNESPEQVTKATEGYVMQQTMLRIKDPKPSLAFYENVLGMKLLENCFLVKIGFYMFSFAWNSIYIFTQFWTGLDGFR